ncbi:MAG: serine hydrolase [Hyphomonadaceae bacterium]|nr:serine hydrolase [Hyphomonadaceae bacterium]
MNVVSRRAVLGAMPWLAAGCMASPAVSSGAAANCALTSTEAASGFDDDKLAAALAVFEDARNGFHGLVIEQAGNVLLERYLRAEDHPISQAGRVVSFDSCALHDMRSISKSVTSLLWGVAQAQGKTPPLNTPVLDLYPALADLKRDGRERITLENLLTMSSGLEWNEENYGSPLNDEMALYWRTSQARATLGRGVVAEPGAQFNYCGGNTAIIADLLSRSTGMSLTDFADAVLFQPLGIDTWSWYRDYRGRPLAFAGLRLRPHDMVRLGRMVLNGGAWEGRQVVPTDWIAASTAPSIATGDGLHYGYFWWLGNTEAADGAHAYVAGFGNGGQRLFIVPSLDLTVAITAGNYNGPAGRLSNPLFHQFAAALLV